MKQVKPSIELQTLLNNSGSRGVEYVLMESDSPVGIETDLHREAAVLFMESRRRLADSFFEQALEAARSIPWTLGLKLKREDCFQLTYDINKAFNCEINLNVFLGYRYCKEQGLPFPEEAWDNDKGEESGYWYAFSEPPYGMNGMPHEKRLMLFHQINELLFGGPDADLDIRQWSTWWSNYFDDGHEFGFDYLWTVHVRGTNRWLAVGASETD